MSARCAKPIWTKNQRFEDYGDVLTCAELAQILKCTEENVTLQCRSGKIPGAIKIGKLWRIHKRTFEAAFGGQ